MVRIRLRFSITAVLGLTFVVAMCIAIVTYRNQIRARTIAVYNAQRQTVRHAIVEFVSSLDQSGARVINESSGSSGSGEWRQCAAITTIDAEGHQRACYVEIMGFVTHNTNGQPTWMGNLPMRVSHRGHELNDQFIALLTRKLERQKWQFEIDSTCHGNPYLANKKPEQSHAPQPASGALLDGQSPARAR